MSSVDVSSEAKSTGGRVVLVMLAGVVLIGALIMVSYLWLSPKAQACANGPDALNPTQTPGVFLPQERTFETIPEAERWICHSIAYPRSAAVTLESVSAFRSTSLQNVVEGEGYAEVKLTYRHVASGKTVELTVAPYRNPDEIASREQVDKLLRPETSAASADRLETKWQKDQLDFRLLGQSGGGLMRADFDAIRDSVR